MTEQKTIWQRSLFFTVLIQLVLLIVLYFVTVWQAPNPPIPVYGIELDMAFSTSTSNTTQETQTPVASSESTDKELIDEPVDSNQSEEKEESTLVNTEEAAAEETPNQNTSNSNTTAEDPPTETIQEIEQQPVKQTSTQQQKTENTEPIKPKEAPSNIKSESTEETQLENKQNEASQPVIDERALFNNPAGNGQSSTKNFELNLVGFRLTEEPDINDTSSESGSIIFNIKVDGDGYVIGIVVASATVSPAVVKIYRDAVAQLFFERTGNQAPSQTSGTIKFIIKAN